ncbi:MAG: phosphatase [Clostridiaceae bacterium]|nr:phosphatase [Clostridiaceae bacterium]
MKLIADCHLHTVASGHAYSTITEYAQEATEKGLELIAMTDHGPKMPGSCGIFHFDNLKVIPNNLYGVEILKGMEANIIDYDGSLDTEHTDLSRLEVLIASFHGGVCLPISNKEENTKAIINSMKNRFVNVIGHPDDSRVELDYGELAKAAADYGVLIEVNNSSLKPGSFRLNAAENYEKLLEECQKYKVYIIINSDSHFHTDVGECDEALELVRKIKYPKELIANANILRLKERLSLRR